MNCKYELYIWEYTSKDVAATELRENCNTRFELQETAKDKMLNASKFLSTNMANISLSVVEKKVESLRKNLKQL